MYEGNSFIDSIIKQFASSDSEIKSKYHLNYTSVSMQVQILICIVIFVS